MKSNLSAFAAGLVFAVGLGIAKMTDPGKVIAFLDITGDWDPSLALVMVGGIGAHMLLYRVILARPSPLVEKEFRVPTRRDLTPQLVVGSGLFGIGWALGGYCPGPALTSVMTGKTSVLVFVVTMAVSMVAHDRVKDWLQRRADNRLAEAAARSPSSHA